MTISKGSAYGEAAAVPDDVVVCATDLDARRAVEGARRQRAEFPALLLRGGDLCRTLGGGGAEPVGLRFPVDLGEALVDGTLHLFVAHCVVRTLGWSDALVAMNAQWLGDWNLGPKAHPGDAKLDVYEARLGLADRWKVRARLPQGAHLPHPGIKERRVAAHQAEYERPRPVRLDGEVVGTARTLSLRLRPDALTVYV